MVNRTVIETSTTASTEATLDEDRGLKSKYVRITSAGGD